MKYKIGDTVTIKKDLNVIFNLDEVEDGFSVTEDMLDYRGEITEIIETNGLYYGLAIDNGMWGWQDNMLEDKVVNRETLKVENVPNMVSYIIDTQYGCYIKSQNVSTEEKMAVKKFIEFIRRNINETKDTEHYTEIK